MPKLKILGEVAFGILKWYSFVLCNVDYMNKVKNAPAAIAAANNEIEITYYNYYYNTSATFRGCNKPKRKPDYVSHNKRGHISSAYWYGENKKGKYVIRYSDHWIMRNCIYSHKKTSKEDRECRRIASCQWKLKTTYEDRSGWAAGKCYLPNFSRM